jgi:hypothetical protein
MPTLDLRKPLPLTPEWWLKHLLVKLKTRAPMAREYDEFHEGQQRLAFASDKFAQVFGRRYARLPSNFMPLVVNAEKDRLVIQGFRFANRQAGDNTAWSIWQENQLDAESLIAHEIALVKGQAFALVTPQNGKTPLITIEDPTEVVVEAASGNRRLRQAALKVYRDDDDRMRAYLYLPDEIYRFRSERPVKGGTNTWESISWEPYAEEGEEFPIKNPLGVVPVIPLTNRPRRDGSGRSEIASIMGNQNAINKLRFDALVASEFVAFPQRWATNIEIPTDPDTGKPIAPFRPGVDTVWIARRPDPDEAAQYGDKFPSAAFGQFPAADLRPYFSAIDSELGLMVAASATPYYYLFGSPSSVPPTGESIKSSEAALVKKVAAQELHFGEGWEEVMRLSLIAVNQQTKAKTDGEAIWQDAETRNEGARTDSVLKQWTSGLLPDEFALEELGYSPQAIARIAAMKAAATPQRVDAAGALVRAGYDPADALRAVGLDPIKHLGLLPVTVQPVRTPTVAATPPGAMSASEPG